MRDWRAISPTVINHPLIRNLGVNSGEEEGAHPALVRQEQTPPRTLRRIRQWGRLKIELMLSALKGGAFGQGVSLVLYPFTPR